VPDGCSAARHQFSKPLVDGRIDDAHRRFDSPNIGFCTRITREHAPRSKFSDARGFSATYRERGANASHEFAAACVWWQPHCLWKAAVPNDIEHVGSR
jgi:hypothetical protein